MSKITRIVGRAAIEYAEATGCSLNKFADPIEGSRDGLSLTEALDVAREDASLIYVDIGPDDVPPITQDDMDRAIVRSRLEAAEKLLLLVRDGIEICDRIESESEFPDTIRDDDAPEQTEADFANAVVRHNVAGLAA